VDARGSRKKIHGRSTTQWCPQRSVCLTLLSATPGNSAHRDG
jgi:hypothetical protein